MTLLELLEQANSVTDEDIDFATGVKFINDCIARINIECGAIYPTYKTADTAIVLPMPEKWQIALFVPFISARIKQIDASKFEFDQFFSEFQINLNLFQMRYTIPELYVDTESQHSYSPDYTGNPNTGDWSRGGSSNDPFTV
jgi:hypothetical protein